ncbi:S1C family serine protease [Haloplasma contractile]|uniref:Trypsin-like serine protease protein n=1 Tax=Haloplasma contractile SSD-17B TaxID=1033810 RepID=U2EED7_9MOLU|nr:trypsin-like peptidase domain-containing protein [Haloplasma contractile]ERJ13348.1 Trypsin-like serine protease protein [Haloplasma contractile SSD-17B]
MRKKVVDTAYSSLLGMILGGLLLYAIVTFTGTSDILQSKIYNKKYNVDVQTIINDAIEGTTNHVVGVVRYQDGKEKGTGSGVIYKLGKNKAYVVTNQHVVEKATEVEIVFPEDERVNGVVIGEDDVTDLAVVEIPRGSIESSMDFSNSEAIKVGEFVIAIGNPLGLEFYGSATLGIVSSTERMVPVDLNKDGEGDWYAKVIQTDAAINPGNSGGALVNVDGKLVGINSMKIAGGQIEGLGFSIPSNLVLKVINDLERHGRVVRPFLGVHPMSVETMSDDLKKQARIPGLNKGVYLNYIQDGSTAEQAGLRAGDVVLTIDGEDVKDSRDFRIKVYKYDIGDYVKLRVLRNNRVKEINLTLKGR